MARRPSWLRRSALAAAGWCSLFALLLSGCVDAQPPVVVDVDCVRPTGIAVADDTSLVVSSAEAGRIFLVGDAGCEALPQRLPRAFGVAVPSPGRICVGHAGSDDPLLRRTVVSCRDPAGWQDLIRDVGSGVNGLLSVSDGLWMLGWRDAPIERSDGLLARIEEGVVVRRIEVPGRVPRFATELPGGELWISVASEDESDAVRSEVVRLDASGVVTSLDLPVEGPEGLAYDPSRDAVWIADRDAGALVLVGLDGTERDRIAGVGHPAGVAVSPKYGACVAETRADRVRCFGGADLEGGSP